MSTAANEHGQPVGAALPDWTAAPPLDRTPLAGRFCSLQPLDAASHASALFKAFSIDPSGAAWTYLPYGPFPQETEFREWTARQSGQSDPLFFAVVDAATGVAVGIVSFLRIHPETGVAEIGHIHFSPTLQRTAAATEALFLMLDHLFGLGYRRCEWKCDALNAPSRRAAIRLGFSYEGTFRQATIVKGRNRDTAWYAMLDGEWSDIRPGFQRWLSDANFDSRGRQQERLSDLIAQARRDR